MANYREVKCPTCGKVVAQRNSNSREKSDCWFFNKTREIQRASQPYVNEQGKTILCGLWGPECDYFKETA